MLYNPFNFQSNDNWDTDGLYWYNEFYTKKLVWSSLNQFHGLQKTGPRWSGSFPAISGSVLDQLQSTVACFGGKKPDWTRLANTNHCCQGKTGSFFIFLSWQQFLLFLSHSCTNNHQWIFYISDITFLWLQSWYNNESSLFEYFWQLVWNSLFNIVICFLLPLYQATNPVCPLWG